MIIFEMVKDIAWHICRVVFWIITAMREQEAKEDI